MKRKQEGHTFTSLVNQRDILYSHIQKCNEKLGEKSISESGTGFRDWKKRCKGNLINFPTYSSEKDWDTNQPFFEALGRKKGGVIKSGDDMDDADVVRQIEQSIVLYR